MSPHGSCSFSRTEDVDSDKDVEPDPDYIRYLQGLNEYAREDIYALVENEEALLYKKRKRRNLRLRENPRRMRKKRKRRRRRRRSKMTRVVQKTHEIFSLFLYLFL